MACFPLPGPSSGACCMLKVSIIRSSVMLGCGFCKRTASCCAAKGYTFPAPGCWGGISHGEPKRLPRLPPHIRPWAHSCYLPDETGTLALAVSQPLTRCTTFSAESRSGRGLVGTSAPLPSSDFSPSTCSQSLATSPPGTAACGHARSGKMSCAQSSSSGLVLTVPAPSYAL